MKWVPAILVIVLALAALYVALSGISALTGVQFFDAGGGGIDAGGPEDRLLPPSFMPGSASRFLLGTNAESQDLWTLIQSAAQFSFGTAALAILLALAAGVPAGLAAGFAGGWIDRAIMRLASWHEPFPPLLSALLADGAIRAALLPADYFRHIMLILAVCIAFGRWHQFARPVRDAVSQVRFQPYVDAARLMALTPSQIAMDHILPNVLTPVQVLLLPAFAFAAMDESALSFMGAGAPAVAPSLGSLLRTAALQMGSGWWLWLFPALALTVPLLAVNAVSAWTQDRRRA